MLEKADTNIGFSVIIPCYNSSSCLERCIKSIYDNQYANCQIIIINDCSTDNTEEIIKECVNKYKGNYTIVNNQTNLGAGESRNIGLKKANMDYLFFLDSDDTISSTALKIFSKIISKNITIDALIYDATFFNALGECSNLGMFYGGKFSNGFIDPNQALVYVKGCSCGKVYRTSIIKENHIEFANLKRNEDMVFNKIAMSYCNKVYYCNERLYQYINNQNSLMNNTNLRTTENAIKGFQLVRTSLEERGFHEEINGIYFIEVLYSVTMTNIRMTQERRKLKIEYKYLADNYEKENKYYSGYLNKYKIAVLLANIGMFQTIRIMLHIKSKRK